MGKACGSARGVKSSVEVRITDEENAGDDPAFSVGRQNEPELDVRVSERGCYRLFGGQIAIDGCCCFATF